MPQTRYQVVDLDGDDPVPLGDFETLEAARILFQNCSAAYCRIWQGHISEVDGGLMFHWLVPLDYREPAKA